MTESGPGWCASSTMSAPAAADRADCPPMKPHVWSSRYSMTTSRRHPLLDRPSGRRPRRGPAGNGQPDDRQVQRRRPGAWQRRAPGRPPAAARRRGGHPARVGPVAHHLDRQLEPAERTGCRLRLVRLAAEHHRYSPTRIPGRRSAGGHVHVAASASTCSPERMSLTWSTRSPDSLSRAPANQTYGMPRRSAYRICLPNRSAFGATSHGMPRSRRTVAIAVDRGRLSSSVTATNARVRVASGRVADEEGRGRDLIEILTPADLLPEEGT